MLADKVEVVTNPGGSKHPDDHARRVVIDGPQGMIAIYPVQEGTGPVTGTEVTLWIKKEFTLVPFDREAVIRDLRYRHYEIGDGAQVRKWGDRELDPALEIGLYVVWPLYPVKLQAGAAEGGALVLDGEFHFRELVPIDASMVQKKAAEWEMPSGDLTRLVWDSGVWQDQDQTGSRVRFVVPRAQGHSGNLAAWVELPNVREGQLTQTFLQAVLEPQLPDQTCRTQLLVNGIVIPDMRGLVPAWEVPHGVGGWCWMDLRGAAAPKLRADRRGATSGQSKGIWEVQQGLHQRALAALQPDTLDSWRWIAHGVGVSNLRPTGHAGPCGWFGELGLKPDPALWALVLLQELYRALNGATDIALDLELAPDDALSLAPDYARYLDRKHALTLALELAPNLDIALALDLDLARDIARHSDLDSYYAIDLARGLELAKVLDRARGRDLAFDLVRSLDRVHHWSHLNAWRCFAESNWLSEAFWPSVEEGLPCLALAGGRGPLAGMSLLGPMELTPDSYALPGWIASRDYDLVAPWTGIPWGALRERCPKWTMKREVRALFILPFLYGKSAFDAGDYKAVAEYLVVPDLLLWMPHPRQMGWRFEDHERTLADWSEGSMTALWDIESGKVLYAEGLHDRESIRKEGVTLRALLRRTPKKGVK
jgi:hypothetical protein